jgi:hypothetical protein
MLCAPCKATKAAKSRAMKDLFMFVGSVEEI